VNYKKIYDSIISQATGRILDAYVERHHILPTCMGGTNDESNLAILTPEEHYVAHQLLVKIYPDNMKLKFAVLMMTGDPHGQRNNKMYGWVRRMVSQAASMQMKSLWEDPIRRQKRLHEMHTSLEINPHRGAGISRNKRVSKSTEHINNMCKAQQNRGKDWSQKVSASKKNIPWSAARREAQAKRQESRNILKD
jgi:hypothetical protein